MAPETQRRRLEGRRAQPGVVRSPVVREPKSPALSMVQQALTLSCADAEPHISPYHGDFYGLVIYCHSGADSAEMVYRSQGASSKAEAPCTLPQGPGRAEAWRSHSSPLPDRDGPFGPHGRLQRLRYWRDSAFGLPLYHTHCTTTGPDTGCHGAQL